MEKIDNLIRLGLFSTKERKRVGRRRVAYIPATQEGKTIKTQFSLPLGKEIDSAKGKVYLGFCLYKKRKEVPIADRVFKVGYYAEDIMEERENIVVVSHIKVYEECI